MGQVGSSRKAPPLLRRFQPASGKPLEHPIGGFEGRLGERGFMSILV